MEHWFPLLVVLSHVAVFHFYYVPHGTRLFYRRALSRNPTWVAEHPEFTADYPKPRLSLWISYAMGLSIYALIFLASDATSERVLINSIVGSVLLVILHCAIYLLRVRRMIRRVPAPEIRQASLERRALRDFLPMSWVYAALVLIAGILVVYTYAFLAEIVPRDLFFRRVSSLFVACFILAGFTLYCLQRKPTEADQLFSSRFRLWEVRGCVAAAYLVVVPAGIWRILSDVFDVYLGTELGVFIAMSIALQSAVVWGRRNQVSPID